MRADLGNNKDFLAGLLFIVLGGLAVFFAGDYPMGWVERMGPGYFPTVLGWILCLFGAYVMLRGLFTGERIQGEWGWKPLGLITLSIVVFGFTMERIGLVPALLVLFFVAALAGRDFRFKEVLLLGILMSAFAAGVFVYGLKLPYPLFGGHY
jgi:putative tricarboxylic transport membrane protein